VDDAPPAREEGMPPAITYAVQARAKGRDIWIRARTNAFAHKLEAAKLGRWSNVSFCLEVTFIVIPIVCVALSLQFHTAAEVMNQKSPVLQDEVLGIIAITSNGIALLIKIITGRLQWSERQLEHQNLLASYQLIAQKARRLDNTEALTQDDINHLCRHLEETFEIYKTTGIEPDDKVFREAHQVLLGLKTYPFGITVNDLK